MILNGTEWSQNELKWSQNGLKMFEMFQISPEWSERINSVPKWSAKVPQGSSQVQKGPETSQNGLKQSGMISNSPT